MEQYGSVRLFAISYRIDINEVLHHIHSKQSKYLTALS